ncbi:replication protein A 70 kDa DNA-binding subunit B [Tanacetum coccineum]
MIKDVDLMLDNITVHGRCISLWHSHMMNQAHNPYSLDMVLQDSQEGQCYDISNFAIAENSGKLPLLPHKYKISFYKGTVVTRIDSFDNNVNGFILEPFNRLLDGTRQYHKHEAVVVAIGDIVPVQSVAGQKIRKTANMWDEYAIKRDDLGHVVFILQLGKVKYWDGTSSIRNALFGTKMFINRDLPEILSFRQRLKELPEYDESQFKISMFTPQKLVVTIANFFHGCSLEECYLASAKLIHRIQKNGWAYTACKECNKKVNVVESKAMSSAGKSKVTFYCEDHGAVQISGYTAWELMEKHVMDVDEYWPGELLDLVGKRCDTVNDDPAFVKHFKDVFLDDEDDDEGFTTPASKLKANNFSDSSLSRVLDMQTPTNGSEALGSGQSSGSKRVFINLDEIDSEKDKEGRANKTPKLVTVKVEKEDP